MHKQGTDNKTMSKDLGKRECEVTRRGLIGQGKVEDNRNHCGAPDDVGKAQEKKKIA